ncbi:MAG: TIGR02300 family protein [Pseudomonadota bacterium]
MAKADLGTKRTCPETGKNFYDLNKDPIVSPYTGIEYPLSFFETAPKPTKAKRGAAKPEDPETDEDEDEIEDDADTGADTDSEDDEDEEKALELGDDADEVVLDGGDDADDDDTGTAKVPAGFTEEGVDDTDEDGVLLDDDDDDFDIDVDDDISLDDDVSDDGDEEKA